MTLQNTFAALLIAGSSLLLSPAASAGNAEPAIDGYCPVAYVAAGKAVKGSADHKKKVDGQTFWFVNKDAKKAFKKAPEDFEVTYEGWCATGVAFGKKVAVDPMVFSVVDGKIYLFSNQEAKQMFDEDPSLAEKADEAWKSL